MGDDTHFLAGVNLKLMVSKIVKMALGQMRDTLLNPWT